MKKTIINSLIISLFFISQINAQSPYELKWKKELSIYGTGLGFGGAAYYFHDKLKPLTIPEINDLQQKGISDWEEWTTMQGSKKSAKASDHIYNVAQALPAILTLADKSMRKDYLKIGVMYTQTFIVNGAMTALVKNTVRRARPFVYDPETPLDEQMTKSARTSFYSGHTSGASSMCFLTARLYADYHPDSKWKPYVWAAAAIVPAVQGTLRMRAGKHFPSDVITGYVMGAVVGYFIPKLHLRKDRSDETTFIKHF